MMIRSRVARLLAFLLPLLLLVAPAAQAQQLLPLPLPAPTTLEPDDPWI